MHVLFSTRFSSEEVSAQNQVKASVQRKIRQSIAEEVQLPVDFFIFFAFKQMFEEFFRNLDKISYLLQYPGLEPVLDDLLPKKSPLIVAKWFVICLRYFPCTYCFHGNCITQYIQLLFLTNCFSWTSPYSQNHLNLVLVNNVPLFFNIRDGPYMPTLRLLHQCNVFPSFFFPFKVVLHLIILSTLTVKMFYMKMFLLQCVFFLDFLNLICLS